jgi:hypothetical protein
MQVQRYCDIHGWMLVDELQMSCPLTNASTGKVCMSGLKLNEADLERNRKAQVAQSHPPALSANVSPNTRETQSDAEDERTAKQRRQGAFLASYEECGRVNVASAAANIDPRTYFRWMKEADFERDFKRSDQIATQHLEDHAVKLARGLDGATTSERLLIKLLEAKKPDVYARATRHEHAGPGGGPMELETLEVSARDEFTSRIIGLASRAATPSTDRQPD